MIDRFQHTFQHALFGVGAFLMLFGAAFAFLNYGSAEQPAGIVEAFSAGFSAFFFALFSGVLIGVGASLIIDGLILGMRGNRAHMVLAFLFCVLSVLIASLSATESGATFLHMIVFFGGLAASGAFLLSTVAFVFSEALHSYLARKKK